MAMETVDDAIAKVNGWFLATEFDAKTFFNGICPLIWLTARRRGTVGDVYFHAAAGEFVGVLTIAEL